jgi:predicted anti-sigma-YlaC factor YlaD
LSGAAAFWSAVVLGVLALGEAAFWSVELGVVLLAGGFWAVVLEGAAAFWLVVALGVLALGEAAFWSGVVVLAGALVEAAL